MNRMKLLLAFGSLLIGCFGSADDGAANGNESADAADGPASSNAGNASDHPDSSAVASSLSGVWVATMDPDQLLRYEPGDSSPSDTLDLEGSPWFVEIVDGVAFYLEAVFSADRLLVQDLQSGERDEITFSEESSLTSMVFADGSLWVADGALDALWRVNPATREVVGGTVLGLYDDDVDDALALGANQTSIYVASLFGAPSVARVSIATETVEATNPEGGDGTTGITVGAGAAWAVSRFDGMLWRYDANDMTSQASISLEADLSGLMRNLGVAVGSVWVLAGSGGNAQDIFGQPAQPGLFRVDASTNEPTTHIALEDPRGLRVHEDAIWVATQTAAVQIDPSDNQVLRTLTPAEGEVADVAFAVTGGGTGSTAGLPAIDVYSVVDPPAQICEDLSIFSDHGDEPLYGNGDATLSVDGASEQLQNGTCFTLRDSNGDVVEYRAFFSDATENPGSTALLTIRNYSGDGTYGEDNYDVGLDYSTADAGGSDGGTAVVTQSGLHAVFTSDDGWSSLELDCDPGADVGLDNRLLAEPEPGEAYVQTGGVVLWFKNVGCSTDAVSDDLQVMAPDFLGGDPDLYDFVLETSEPAEAGLLPGELSYAFYGESDYSWTIEVDLACTSPVTGTFSDDDLEGAFTCP